MKEGSHAHNQTQRVRKVQNGPTYLSSKKISGGQQEEGHGVVHHDQWEHYQSYLLHQYQNASIQGQIQCRKDQMQVSHVEKNMVEVKQVDIVNKTKSISFRWDHSWLNRSIQWLVITCQRLACIKVLKYVEILTIFMITKLRFTQACDLIFEWILFC